MSFFLINRHQCKFIFFNLGTKALHKTVSIFVWMFIIFPLWGQTQNPAKNKPQKENKTINATTKSKPAILINQTEKAKPATKNDSADKTADKDNSAESKQQDKTADIKDDIDQSANSDSGNPIEQAQEKEHPLLKKAEKYYFEKNYHIALKLLKKIIDEDPENVAAYLYAGDIHLLQQNYGLAEEHFQIARELSKNPYKEWFRLGQTRFLRNDSTGALAAFEKSLQSNPKMYINHFYIGLVYYHIVRNKEKTISAWKEFRLKVPADPQGPAIDKALDLLAKPDFQFPPVTQNPCIQIPSSQDSRVKYKPGVDEKTKTNNTTKPIIEEDEL